MKSFIALVCLSLFTINCSGENATSLETTSGVPTETGPSLGLRPQGDTEISPDLSQVSDELKQVFDYIDENFDDDVRRLQRWVQQPSISNTGEGIPESAQMVRGFWQELGCEAEVHEVGETEWGAQGNPVVYAHCDEGADQTLLIYWMYDTMPITQPDLWNYPPFAAELVEQPPFPKVLIGRGATNSKGGQMSQYNALRAIKEVHGKFPVNIMVIAEGDEERMSIGLRTFVQNNPELFETADAMVSWGRQSFSGRAGVSGGGSEGCVYIELTTSGAKWGRGPVYGDIHGGRKRAVDSPAWRHIEMLRSIIDDTGNIARVDGFYDNVEPLSAGTIASLKESAAQIDIEEAARTLGVARFISDDPFEYLRMAQYGLSFNLDGIWGGNMYGGGAGAILPSKITSKHNIRYQPVQDGIDIVEKIKAQIDRNGYEDVEMQIIGDVPWRKATVEGPLPKAQLRTLEIFNIPHNVPRALRENEQGMTGGYWPAYLFGKSPINIPISGAGAGYGAGSHANNEFYVIEGAGQVYGMAGAEKAFATIVYGFGGKN
jgi:acetylornithine deacetylase/succinyl-diaminopimelate desuccinylase-like protein